MNSSNGIGDLKQVLSSIVPTTTPKEAVSSTIAKDANLGTSRDGHTDEARLSSTSGVIARSLEGSDVRTEKVEALQKTIASGAYNISSSDVADKMIQSLLE